MRRREFISLLGGAAGGWEFRCKLLMRHVRFLRGWEKSRAKSVQRAPGRRLQLHCPQKNLVAASEQNHLCRIRNIRRATERLGQGEVRRSNGTCRNLRSHQQAALVPTGGRRISNDRRSFIAGR